MFVPLALLLLLSPLSSDSLSGGPALSLLRGSVTAYAQPFDPNWDPAAIRVAWTDLNADGLQDALVYLDGPAWCGSGGCTLLVVAAVDSLDVPELGAYVPIAEISLMHGPVTVASEQTNGWHDLAVKSASGEWHRLAFDGETYPFSPSEGGPMDAPVVDGTVLFADA